MGDDKAGAAAHQPEQGFLDPQLGPGIHAARRLVQDEDGGVGENGAGYREKLPLPWLRFPALSERFV